jgi:hypothetical protein
MKDFNQAFIYKITNGVLDYYGSSSDTYEQRKSTHVAPSNHCTSKKIIKSGLPWSMDIIEWFPCSCVEELEDREAWYIMNNECVNEKVPGAIRRAGGVKAYHKKYGAENAETIKSYNKQYREDNADKIKQQVKQYQSDNAETIKTYQKQYKTENAEDLKAKAKTIQTCDVCGAEYTLSNKARHYKTKKHQKAIAEAVATHTPPQPQTINNTINCQVCNITQQK